MKLVYDVNDKPVMSKTIVFALQQMIAIMAATLLVPMLVTSFGLEADPAAALFGAGIGTLVYIFFTKKKYSFPRWKSKWEIINCPEQKDTSPSL